MPLDELEVCNVVLFIWFSGLSQPQRAAKQLRLPQLGGACPDVPFSLSSRAANAGPLLTEDRLSCSAVAVFTAAAQQLKAYHSTT